MPLVINKKHLKLFALGVATHKAHKLTRVSKDFYIKADAAMKLWSHKYVMSLPSKGKTIK